MSMNSNEVKNAFFIGVGFRGAVADNGEYLKVLESWKNGESALIERFETFGNMISSLYVNSHALNKNEQQAEVSKLLGAWLCEHVAQLGYVPDVERVELEIHRFVMAVFNKNPFAERGDSCKPFTVILRRCDDDSTSSYQVFAPNVPIACRMARGGWAKDNNSEVAEVFAVVCLEGHPVLTIDDRGLG